MLLKEFSTIFDRPEKVKKLREYILSLAVRGKLVEQDENDEPASVLLERIREEKDRLVKEKKIKKEKPLPEISEDEIPYELPKGWEWVRLGNCIITTQGVQIPKSEQIENFKEGYIRYLYIGDFNNDNNIKYVKNEYPNKIITEKDLIMVNTGSTAGTIFYGKYGILSNNLFSMSFDDTLLDKNYLYYYLKSPIYKSLVLGNLKGGANPHLGHKKISECIFSYPPLNEQKKIVEKLDYLMEFCDKLEEQLEKQVKYATLSAKSILNSVSNCSSYEELEEALRFIIENFKDLTLADGAVCELKNAILSLAVKGKLVPQDDSDEPASLLLERIREEKDRLVKEKKIKKEKPLPEIGEDEIPYELPKGWEWVRLNNICSLITDGTHSTPKYTEYGVPFLSVKDLSKGFIDFSNTRFISEEEHTQLIKRCNPQYGDILLTKVGTTGIAKSIDTDKEFSIFVSVALLKIFNQYIDSIFLEKLINSPLVKKQSEENTQGVGNKNLVLKCIKNFIIPIPPLNEQRRIVEKVDKLMKVCDELELIIEKSKKYSEQLMKSILKKHMG